MEYAKLGPTGLTVSRMCLGTAFRSGADPERSAGAIEKAFDLGCNFLDTANIYQAGRSEEIVGKAIKGRRDLFVVTTKVGMQTGEDPNHAGLSRKTILREAEGSLTRLGTDFIDLYLLHQPDPETPIEESIQALEDLRRDGKIRYAGVSNFPAWQVCDALWAGDRVGGQPLVCNQVAYSLLDRRIEEELVPFCLDKRVSITAYCTTFIGLLNARYRYGRPKPQGGSWDGGPYSYDACLTPATDRVIEALTEIGEAHGATATQAAMAWCLAKPAVTCVISGADSAERVASNFDAVDLELSDEDQQRLDTVSARMRTDPRKGQV